jgi:hypothetical protein
MPIRSSRESNRHAKGQGREAYPCGCALRQSHALLTILSRSANRRLPSKLAPDFSGLAHSAPPIAGTARRFADRNRVAGNLAQASITLTHTEPAPAAEIVDQAFLFFLAPPVPQMRGGQIADERSRARRYRRESDSRPKIATSLRIPSATCSDRN